MKKYRLKQWYPDTPSYMMAGFIVDYYDEEEKAIYTYPDGMRLGFKLPSHHLECRNFWELIEEKNPLFITDDGVEMLDRDSIVWMVRNKTLEKIKIHSIHLNECDFEHKVFAHESSADKYIWQNKRVFSYEDFMRWGNVPYERVIKELAMERIEE